jgi:hypothetical protein
MWTRFDSHFLLLNLRNTATNFSGSADYIHVGALFVISFHRVENVVTDWEMARTVCLAMLGLVGLAAADDVLSTSGFTECGNGSQQWLSITFILHSIEGLRILTLQFLGFRKFLRMWPYTCVWWLADKIAQINVTALGNVVYTNHSTLASNVFLILVDNRYNIQELCPIPAGPFHGNGNLTIPRTT